MIYKPANKNNIYSIITRSLAVIFILFVIPVYSFAEIQAERFNIDHFNIKGNTLLKPVETDAALKPFIGEERSYVDIKRATEALMECYRSRGYNVVWVDAPEQDLSAGVVTLNVIEAHIGKKIGRAHV